MGPRKPATLMAAVLAAYTLLTPGSAVATPQDTVPDGAHDGSEGIVESAEACTAFGWAVDPDQPNRSVTVRVLADSDEVWTGQADLFREDLLDQGISRGYSGFEVNLADAISLGVAHEIRVQAQDLQTGSWHDLAGTPRTLTCPSTPPTGSHDIAEGSVTFADCVAAGWATDPDDWYADVSVRILVDASEVWTGIAADFRDDLLEAGIGDGTSAFAVALNELMTPEVQHEVRVQAQDLSLGEWVDLDGTPRTLSCAANHPPEGVLEGADGVIASPFLCFATGWALDPDQPDPYIELRVLVDGTEAWLGANGQFRATLDWLVHHDGMPDGAVPFLVDLAPLMSADEPHEITVQARDPQTELWVDLSGSPRIVTCSRVEVASDILRYSTRSGEVVSMTSGDEVGEFDPDWSPSGGAIVFDQEGYGEDARLFHRLAILDPVTGIATPVPGSENADDAAWSPNGKWLAFDRYVDFEQYPPYPPCFACEFAIYILPRSGGTPVKVADDAFTPDWAPNNQHLAIWRPSDDTLWTVDLNGNERPLGVNGLLPAWSPNGHWIAYTWLGNLWKIPVDVHGNPTGDAIQLTFGGWDFNDAFPTWSPDGRTIYFSSSRTQVAAIWRMAADGTSATQLTEPVAGTLGDGSPSVSRDGRYVLFQRIH